MSVRFGRRTALALACSAFLAFAAPAASFAQEENAPPEGFRALFDGSTLNGWRGMPHFDPYELAAMSDDDRAKFFAEQQASIDAHWSVDDGAIVNDGDGAYLTTVEEFGDYELMIDYRTVALADSGIYLRATPQVQIWDTTEAGGKWSLDADKGSGGLWNNSPGAPGKNPSALMDRPFGEWNRFRIRQVGERTSIWLNGTQVVDNARMENFWRRESPMLRRGPIQLQTHGGEIRWKNIFIREIGTDEANSILASIGNDGYESAFNGVDFSGWAGPVDNYEIEDGILRCKPEKGGTIYTEKEYGDFQVRFEFKLPPGGNNGLAIRYPGSGDTAYVGMCELQILDTEDPRYAGLDPRQVHGSAYGMAAAARGYHRPTGEWNIQEVTVVGSTIKVELNGFLILNTDLSKVTEYLADSPHPGKDRTRGYFGFAGHSDPVEFRHVMIRSLD
ncbi:MAG TPA: DUF1080 domain-containing protein [Pirellulaceae bacterium]|nr:DUF1080 domain-containing protein [Pirellulaceae bacterium]